MREDDSLAKQVRDIQLDLQELKQIQFTGKDQIVVQEYETETISMPTYQRSELYYYRRCYVRIDASDLPEGSVLLAHVMPVITYNGSVVQNKSTSGNITTMYYVNPYRSADLRKASFYLLLIDTPPDGSDSAISSRTYSVKFKVYVSAKANVAVGLA